jgi:hypothetical protein
VIVDTKTGAVTPFITGLPTGDHLSEQLAFKDGWIYWSQGSTTNSGVVGRDNVGGANQPDIACQEIKLSDNVFDAGGGKMTSGYPPLVPYEPDVTQNGHDLPGSGGHGVIERGDDDEFAELQGGGRDSATEHSQVVLVAMTDLLDESVGAQVFESPRQMGWPGPRAGADAVGGPGSH